MGLIMGTPNSTAPSRNVRLDFFRGVALMIIFVNHIPFNPLYFYTPSRFGFSDAAEIFVFLSGFAAALAYGRCFERAGMWLGMLRILHRCGQIYVSHLALFFVLAGICAIGNQWLGGEDYIHRLYLRYFFESTPEAIAALFSLRYVPNFFDILPMYFVILLWVPLAWSLSRVHVALGPGVSVLMYLGAWHFGWELPAEPAGDRPWFFNPFAWQLLFFTGFGLGAGWLRVPRASRGLTALCLALVLVSIPLGHEPTYQRVAFLGLARAHLEPWVDKSHLGLLRLAHFLALAYLMNRLLSGKAHWLDSSLPRWIARIGRQSLPVFLFSMTLSYLAGMALDWSGRDAFDIAWVNLAGLGLMLGVAWVLEWLDSKPWKVAAAVPAPVQFPPRIAGQNVWAGQMALVFLAASPLLILLPEEGDSAGVSLVASVGQAADGLGYGHEVIYQPKGEERIEWQDGI